MGTSVAKIQLHIGHFSPRSGRSGPSRRASTIIGVTGLVAPCPCLREVCSREKAGCSRTRRQPITSARATWVLAAWGSGRLWLLLPQDDPESPAASGMGLGGSWGRCRAAARQKLVPKPNLTARNRPRRPHRRHPLPPKESCTEGRERHNCRSRRFRDSLG